MKYRLNANACSVVIEGERIGIEAAGRIETFAMPDWELRPGLINAHEHLAFNHFPRLGEPPYRNAYEWGLDLHARWAADIARVKAFDRHSALLFGALKNVLGGVTSVVHHDRWEGDFDNDFPVRVARVRNAHSLRFDPDLAAAFAEARAAFAPIAVHLAEGIDEEAAAEPLILAGAGHLNERVIAVHNVGIDTLGVRALSEAGSAVVWCPTANQFLFGQTAPRELFDADIDVLLGTDSLLTGAGTMLDELRAARSLRLINDDRLLDAVGKTAARRCGLPEPSLATWGAADVVAWSTSPLDATVADVRLVVVRGRPYYGDVRMAPLFELCGVIYERMTVAGQERIAEASLVRAAADVIALTPECARILN